VADIHLSNLNLSHACAKRRETPAQRVAIDNVALFIIIKDHCGCVFTWSNCRDINKELNQISVHYASKFRGEYRVMSFNMTSD